MVITLAMHSLVLDDARSRWKVRAVPDVAGPGIEVEFCACFRRHAEGDISAALVAHDMVRYVVLPHFETWPIGDLLMADYRATSDGEERDADEKCDVKIAEHVNDSCGNCDYGSA
jgi:hypothetical protein